ncbi:MAG: histidine ammonia-lyase [Anaerolineaceae bacterium]|nr:histidine ammonia-lyase [Anaerolineaceae bacterium]
MQIVELDGNNLTVDLVKKVADHWENPEEFQVSISAEAVERVNRARKAVEGFVEREEIIYGITTGFGDFKDKIIPLDQVQQLQRNIILSHGTGVGPSLNNSIVRAMMVVRLHTFLKGHSGVRIEVIDSLVQMVNKGVYPVVPAKGSLGASGDLAPLAHVAQVLLGEGAANHKGGTLSGAEAMRVAEIPVISPEAKEGLALTNGTSLLTAVGALAVYKAEQLIPISDIIAAMSIEAMRGTLQAFDPRIHAVRAHPGQEASAKYIHWLLEGSQLMRGFDPLDVQDPYSMRCTPQVHGSARDTITHAKKVIEIELNSAVDNPLIFIDENEKATCLSGGNFHGEPVAIPMDNLKVGLAEFANISERRLARLVDEKANRGVLPPFLTNDGGLNSGFMMVQYSSAALVSENKVLAHPASVDSIPSSANTEDHVSMGTIAARQAFEIAENVEYVLALELFAAVQALDFRLQDAIKQNIEVRMGKGTQAAYQTVREVIPFIEYDSVMHPHIEAARELIVSGKLLAAVRSAMQD